MGCPNCSKGNNSRGSLHRPTASFTECSCSKSLKSGRRDRIVRIGTCQGAIDCGNSRIGDPFAKENAALKDSGISRGTPGRFDFKRRVALGCTNCVPQPTKQCGQAEIGGRNIYFDFSGITSSAQADQAEQIFIAVVNKYSSTTWRCYSSVAGIDYHDPCERPRFERENYRNGSLYYGILTYQFNKKHIIKAEQLAILIVNDVNVALASAGLPVTVSYRF